MAGATDGIRIAFNSQAFDPSPTWVRVDGGVGLSPNASMSTTAWSLDRGRQFQLDATQTGTSTITLYFTDGMFDATNPNGPFYGEIGPLRQVSMALQNPVNNLFYPLFTGFTESWEYTYPMTPSAALTEVVVNCVDGFDALGRANLPVSPDGSFRVPPFVGANAVKFRIQYILQQFDAGPFSAGQGYPTDYAALYSGNVNTLGAVYNGQTSFLAAIMDTADAESGGLANNVFMDKYGNVAFRGRGARFTPQAYENVGAPTLSLPITFWTVGDENAANSITNCAPIFDIEWDEDDTRLINNAWVYPGGINNQGTINGNFVSQPSPLITGTNPILKYGPRSNSVPDLYCDGSSTLGGANPFLNPPGLTGLQETKLYAQSMVDNFCLPFPHISKLTFQTPPPEQKNWAAWWNFVCGVEIGDVITVHTTFPGGGGFSTGNDGFATDQFIVEGLHYSATVGGQYPQLTVSVDVSPRQWAAYFNGFQFYPQALNFGSDGHVTNGSGTFNATTAAFVSGDVGNQLVIFDSSAAPDGQTNPGVYRITNFTSTTTVTISPVYAGTSSTTAPWQMVGP